MTFDPLYEKCLVTCCSHSVVSLLHTKPATTLTLIHLHQKVHLTALDVSDLCYLVLSATRTTSPTLYRQSEYSLCLIRPPFSLIHPNSATDTRPSTSLDSLSSYSRPSTVRERERHHGSIFSF